MRAAAGAVVTLLACAGPLAAWHAPHDVASLVVVSPDFANDGTVLARMQLTNRMLLARSTDGGDTWELLGTPMMVLGVTDIVFSPDYASDRTVFASTATGGVWRSEDGCDSWTAVDAGLGSPNVQQLAVSPDFADDDTLFAATVAGVFRSTDRGATWVDASAGLTDPVLAAIAATDDPDVLFAGRRSLYRTDDGGQTWTEVEFFTTAIADIETSPAYSSDTTVAVAFGRFGGGIEVSEDGGATWTTSTPADEYVNDVEFADGGTVFAVTETDGCFTAPSVHGPWTLTADGFEVLSDQTDNHYNAVAPSPTYAGDGVVFVAAFEGLHRSDDAAATWRQRDVYSVLVNKRVRFSPDFADDREIYFGNYGGGVYAYRLPPTPADAPRTRGGPGLSTASLLAGPAPLSPSPGATGGPTSDVSPWTLRHVGLGTPYCLALDVSPDFTDDRTLAYAFAGFWRSVDAGAAWDAIGLPTSVSVIRDVSFSPDFANDLTLFASTSNEPQLRSLDGGLSWQTLGGGLPPDLNVQTLALSPAFAADRLVWLGSDGDGVWRSADGGDTWSQTNTGLTSPSLRDVAPSPDLANDGLVLAGTVGDGVFRSTDGGVTWSPSNAGLPDGEPLIVESFAFSPDVAHDGTVFAALLAQGVHVSHDRGLTWQPVGPGLPASAPRDIAVSPDFPSDRTVVVSTYDWSYISRDAGASWTRLPGFGRVDDKHPVVEPRGDWIEIAVPGAFAQRVASSGTAGDERAFTFHGRSVTWYAARDSVCGQADVFVDGAFAATVDLYAPSTEPHVPVFERRFAVPGLHTISVRVTGTASAPATDVRVHSDGFAYTF